MPLAKNNYSGGDPVNASDLNQIANNANLDLINLIAGENISLGGSDPVPIFVNSGIPTAAIFYQADNAGYFGYICHVYGNNYFGSHFWTTPSTTKLTKISLLIGKVSSPTGNVVLDLYALDANDKPTGASLGTVTIACSAVTTGYNDFVFASPITVTPLTKYGYVLKATSANSSNYILWQTIYLDNTSEFYSTDAGATWTVSGYQTYSKVYGYQDLTIGSAYVADNNNANRNIFLGFAMSDGTLGGNLLCQLARIINGFTSLSAGKKYYINTLEVIDAQQISVTSSVSFYGNNWYCQTFKPLAINKLTKISLYLYPGTNPDQEAEVRIYATDVNGKPTGT